MKRVWTVILKVTGLPCLFLLSACCPDCPECILPETPLYVGTWIRDDGSERYVATFENGIFSYMMLSDSGGGYGYIHGNRGNYAADDERIFVIVSESTVDAINWTAMEPPETAVSFYSVAENEITLLQDTNDDGDFNDPQENMQLLRVGGTESDRVAPLLVNSYPSDGATSVPVSLTAVLEFNEPMSSGYSITYYNIGGISRDKVWLDSTHLQIEFLTPLPSNTTVHLVLNPTTHDLNFRDQSGNPVHPDSLLTFTTGG